MGSRFLKFADASPKLPQNSSPKLIEDHTAFLPTTIHSLPRSSLYLSVIFIVLCPHCHGQGLIREVKDVVKHPGVKGIPLLLNLKWLNQHADIVQERVG